MKQDRITAAFLALFLTPFGVPFFYLGRTKLGMICIALTVFAHGPFKLFLAVVGVGLFFYYIGMNDEEFKTRYRTPKTKRKNTVSIPINIPQFGRTDSALYENADARRSLQPSEEPLINLNTLYQNAIKRATDKYNAFDYDGAIADFKEALQYRTKDATAFWNLSCCYSVLEQKQEAFQALEKAVASGIDTKKIAIANELAFVRLQPEFPVFAENKYRLTPEMIADLQKVLA